jgi:hypothetical protein
VSYGSGLPFVNPVAGCGSLLPLFSSVSSSQHTIQLLDSRYRSPIIHYSFLGGICAAVHYFHLDRRRTRNYPLSKPPSHCPVRGSFFSLSLVVEFTPLQIKILPRTVFWIYPTQSRTSINCFAFDEPNNCSNHPTPPPPMDRWHRRSLSSGFPGLFYSVLMCSRCSRLCSKAEI